MATINVLVIGGVPSINWKELFQNETIASRPIRIERVHWEEIVLVSYHDSGMTLDLYPKQGSKNQTTESPVIGFQPHFIVFRSAGRGIFGQDFRNVLYGIMHANIPTTNSVDSIYLCQEKPIIYGKLNTLKKKLGKERFPLIPQTYYASWKGMSFHTDLPLVVKFGTCHSGFGKMRIATDSDFEDIRSIAALQPNYVTAEPFIDWDYDVRIQKIGHHYRAFRRTSSNWKGKGASQQDIDIEVTDQYKLWVDEASATFGMDVCAIDAVHSKTDDIEYILELNDSAIGFNIRHHEEDLLHLKELILLRLSQAFPDNSNNIIINDDILSEEVKIVENNNNNEDSDPLEKKPRDDFNQLSPEEQIAILRNRLNKLEKENQELKKNSQQPSQSENKGGFFQSLLNKRLA